MLHPHIDLSLWQEQDFGVESHTQWSVGGTGADEPLGQPQSYVINAALSLSFPPLRKKQNKTMALSTLHNILSGLFSARQDSLLFTAFQVANAPHLDWQSILLQNLDASARRLH